MEGPLRKNIALAIVIRNWLRVLLFCSAGLLAAPAAMAAIVTHVTLPDFAADVGSVTEYLDFEDLPPPFHGILSNPFIAGAVTILNAGTLRYGLCASPTCPPDSPNDVGDVEIFLNPGATISFAPGVNGAMLRLAGIGAVPFVLEALDYAGETAQISATSTLFGVDYAGFVSAAGIQTITIVLVNQPGGAFGPLVVSAILTSVPVPAVGWLVAGMLGTVLCRRRACSREIEMSEGARSRS